MKLKKLFALGLIAGMVAGSLTTADAAKKRKPKLVAADQQYFLRWDGTADSCGTPYLSVEDGEDIGNGCEFTFQAAQEVLIASGQGALTRDWPAMDGVPFVLNAKKPITGQINIFQLASVAGSLEVVLSGTAGGKGVKLGTATVDVETSPMDTTTVEFEISPPAKLHKKKFTSFNLNTTQRGVAISYMELEDPPSSLTIPTLKKK